MRTIKGSEVTCTNDNAVPLHAVVSKTTERDECVAFFSRIMRRHPGLVDSLYSGASGVQLNLSEGGVQFTFDEKGALQRIETFD